MKNTCKITISDDEDGKVKVNLTFKKAIDFKSNRPLTPSENLAFDTLNWIKNQQA